MWSVGIHWGNFINLSLNINTYNPYKSTSVGVRAQKVQKSVTRDFPGNPAVKTSPSNAGGRAQVWSLVRELSSHMPHGQKKVSPMTVWQCGIWEPLIWMQLAKHCMSKPIIVVYKRKSIICLVPGMFLSSSLKKETKKEGERERRN